MLLGGTMRAMTTKDELLARAEELGLQVSKSMTNAAISAAVSEAEAAVEAAPAVPSEQERRTAVYEEMSTLREERSRLLARADEIGDRLKVLQSQL